MALIDIKGREITKPVFIPTPEGEIDLQSAGGDVDLSTLATKEEVGDPTDLVTTDKTDLVSAINEVFTNASNGKDLISTAVTGVGGIVGADPTFQDLADQIDLTYLFSKPATLIPDNVKEGVTIGDTIGTMKPATFPKIIREELTVTPRNVFAGANTVVSNEQIFASSARNNIVGFSIVPPADNNMYLLTTGQTIDNTYNSFAKLRMNGSTDLLTSYYSGLTGKSQTDKKIQHYHRIDNGQGIRNLQYKDYTLPANDLNQLTYTFEGFPPQNGISLSLQASNSKAHPNYTATAYISGSTKVYIYYYE